MTVSAVSSLRLLSSLTFLHFPSERKLHEDPLHLESGIMLHKLWTWRCATHMSFQDSTFCDEHSYSPAVAPSISSQLQITNCPLASKYKTPFIHSPSFSDSSLALLDDQCLQIAFHVFCSVFSCFTWRNNFHSSYCYQVGNRNPVNFE